MKVKELIEELKKLDKNKVVVIQEESEFLHNEIIFVNDDDDEVVAIEYRNEE